jgi:methionyl-tRNA synthetase
MIEFEDFEKLDLRVAEVLSVEDHPNADKLYVLKVDLGDEQRQIVAGLKQYYKPEELKGKKLVMIANLKPIKLRGVESQGMLLAAGKDDKVAFLSPEKDMENGSVVG